MRESVVSIWRVHRCTCLLAANWYFTTQVRLAEGDKWQDVEYLKHTSLKTYMPYMMGGGYVLSADLAHVILGINQQVGTART